jgi:large subunit ribosomal protein L17
MMMLRNMATSLFDKERIQTTLPKAKQLRPYAEKLITLARRGDLHSRRLVLQQVLNKDVVKKLFDDIAKRYDKGQGGYLRIVQYSARWGDGAQRAFIELTTKPVAAEPEKPEKGSKKKATAKGKEATAKSKETSAKAAPEAKKTRKKAVKEEKETE